MKLRRKFIMSNCPNCGNDIPSGNKFCTRCGYKIEEGAPIQPTAPTQPQKGFHASSGFDTPSNIDQPVQEQNAQNYQPIQSEQPVQTNYYTQTDNNYQPQDYYPPYTPKKNKVLPIIISACALFFVAIAVFLVVILTQPSKTTPEGAVKIAITEYKKSTREIAKTSVKYRMDLDGLENQFMSLYDDFIGTFEYDIKDVDINGTSATVTISYSIVDMDDVAEAIYDKYGVDIDDDLESMSKNKAKEILSLASKEVKKAYKREFEEDLELHKSGNEWQLDSDLDYIFN